MPKNKKNSAGVHVGLTAVQVKKAYKKNDENASATARELGVSTATVNYHLKKES